MKSKLNPFSSLGSLLLLLLIAFSVFIGSNKVSAIKIPDQWVSSAVTFAAGGVGGVCSVLVGHPLDLVKVRQQTGSADKKDDSGKNIAEKGTFAILRDIIAKEGFKGIYRGVSAPLVAVSPIWATSFWGFDTGDKLVRLAFSLAPNKPLPLLPLCLAGGFSAFPTALVMVPCERVKCLLQIQSESKGPPKYKGFGDCCSQLIKESGVSGLYKGTVLTLMRDVPGNMIYFGVYTIAYNRLGQTPAAALVAGAMAGVSLWPAILPLDVLKSRYQTAPEGTYKNIGEAYKDLVDENGVKGLFNGITPAMIRSAPANSISFLGAEMTKAILLGGKT